MQHSICANRPNNTTASIAVASCWKVIFLLTGKIEHDGAGQGHQRPEADPNVNVAM
ncbi:hypothetical protein KG088_00970 [Halomonas sp. TRM85114]|uniref:hypothetical protein n=1 Tax=Halomonas jincaotanensis TaxID=2810616 RepID=UPI001BD4E221|nr:hypothetical protein [Halomonas jincaotanensis]MBS9402199.1 hypothetical protein [Halomonas jincaotanensis]